MEAKTVPKKQSARFTEEALTKGQLRKLNALRKSLGVEIADKAFAEWLDKIGSKKVRPPVDKNAEAIAEALAPLIKAKRLKIARGGYLVTRWRDRVVVKPASSRKQAAASA